MAQATRRKRPPSELFSHLWQGLRESGLWVAGLVALYLLVALVTYSPTDASWSHSVAPGPVSNAGGVIGAYIADALLNLFGWLAYLLPLVIAYGGWLIYRERLEQAAERARPSRRLLLMRGVGAVMLLLSATGLLAMHTTGSADPASFNPGGILGLSFNELLISGFNRFGASLMLLALFVAGVTLLTGLSWFWVMDVTGAVTLKLIDGIGVWLAPRTQSARERLQGYREQRSDRQAGAWAAASEAAPSAVAAGASGYDDPLYPRPRPKKPKASAAAVTTSSGAPGIAGISGIAGLALPTFAATAGGTEQAERSAADKVPGPATPQPATAQPPLAEPPLQAVPPASSAAAQPLSPFAAVAAAGAATSSAEQQSAAPLPHAAGTGVEVPFGNPLGTPLGSADAPVAEFNDELDEAWDSSAETGVDSEVDSAVSAGQDVDVATSASSAAQAVGESSASSPTPPPSAVIPPWLEDDRHEPVMTMPAEPPPPDEGEPVIAGFDELMPPLTATGGDTDGDATAALPPMTAGDDVGLPWAPAAEADSSAPAAMPADALAAAAIAATATATTTQGTPAAAAPAGGVAGGGAGDATTLAPTTTSYPLIPKPPLDARTGVAAPQVAPALQTPPPYIPPELREQRPLPSLALLDPGENKGPAYPREVLEQLSRLVEEKLNDFGVIVQVVAVNPGPVITRFELQPAPGLKVSRIVNLSKDLARSLSVERVRVVEVIPGKSTIGLEIPNHQRQTVRLSEVFHSRQYDHSRSPLSLALGKDIGGKPVVVDLAKMPHLLVAGTTGSGKSVSVNAMILSLLYKARPDEVRLIMVDPKMLELSIYDGIPHLLSPVVTDMKEAAHALRWCVVEMERRYQLMAAMGVRNIKGFNKKVSEAAQQGQPIPDPLQPELEGIPQVMLEPLPYIVVVVDELADLMMVVGKKIEELIARLAQKARAAGLHLILATQRPSVDVITGLIKANIPTRIAFQVSSKVDSRTILDQMGAEALLGMGDMLYLAPGTGIPTRVHGAFVDDHEVHNVVEELKLYGEPDYLEEITEEGGAEAPEGVLVPGDPVAPAEDIDPLYDQAVRIVTETRRASISGVQRRLKIGYNRAARLVEAMEAAGIVGPQQSNGNREVLAPPPVES